MIKINNIVDDNYKYKNINEVVFNNKYLLCNSDGSKYRKYLLVCYRKDNNILYVDIPNESYLDNFTNIIKIYKVEEIISSCTCFDNMYDELIYYHIDDLYFIKYLINEEYYMMFESDNDYEKIYNFFTLI